MKKSLGTYFTQYFKMPHVYRDDLQAIEKIIREDLQPQKYSLACGGFEYDSLDDVSDIVQTRVLAIYTHSPCLRLKFASSWTELYAGDDGAGVDQAVRNIAAIVSRGERRWLWNFCISSSWLAPLIGFGSFALIFGSIAVNLLPIRYMALVILTMILMSIWWAIGYNYRLHSFSCIDLLAVRSPEHWLSRHRQSVLLTLAALTLGSVATLLLIGFFRSL